MNQLPIKQCLREPAVLDFFRFLGEADAAVLTPYFECRQAAAGETLWQEGEPCDGMVFIVEGRLEMKKETEFAGKQVIVGVYGQGAVAGELCLLDGTPYTLSAVALEDTALVWLSRDNFQRLKAAHPEAALRLLEGIVLTVSIRLRKAYERLASIF